MSLRAARQAILALTVVVSVASAADASGPRPQPPVTVYDCDDLATITTRRFADRLELSGRGQAPMILPQIGEDPVTFADATVTVTMNADYLRMTGPMGGPVCRRNVEEAPWQEARLRGIEFRATGSQPEWVLEYDEGSALTFVAGGFPSITATRLSVAVTSGDRMTITGSDGTREILVTIARAVCSGSSGVMTARVVVTTEGRAFSGCGRMLPSGKFRGTVNHDVRLPPLAVLSIRIVRIGRDAAQSRLVIATWKGPIGPDADASFEVDYNPSLLFGDDRFTIEACIQAGSQTRCNRRRPLVLTWGAFGSVTLSPEMFTDRSLTTLSASGERVFGSFVQKTSQPDSAAARMLTHPTCSARAA